MSWIWIVLILCSYIIGSFPSAYVFVELKLHKDIRSCGTGNVGALNSYEVTGSKWVGLLVLLVDFFKGAAAIALAQWLIPESDIAKMLASLCVVLGHNYPVWLSFKGGRGLATIAGSTLFFIPLLPLAWCGFWVVLRLISHSVHFCNVFATFLLMALALILLFFSSNLGFYFALILCTIILLSHSNVMRAAFLRQ